MVPHYKENFGEPVKLSELKTKYPLTFGFFKEFEDNLRSRSGYKQLHGSRPEFYVVGNVGDYALSPYKVVFKDLTEFFQCAVVGPQQKKGKDSAPVVPDHTVLFIACQSADEAHFFCGLLNSIPSRVALYCCSVGVQTQRYFPTDVARVKLPAFGPSDEVHRSVVRLSKLCHKEASGANDASALNSLERELTKTVAPIWGISQREVSVVAHAFEEIQGFRKFRGNADKDEGEE